MLIEFRIKNFRSIRDEVTLSMLASEEKGFESSNLVSSEVSGELTLLRSLVIFGANASGKTNVILALKYLKGLVLRFHNNIEKNKIAEYSPFKLDRNYLDKPTEFTINFIEKGVDYWYFLSFDEEEIIEESLFYDKNGKETMIFERKNSKYSFERGKGKAIFFAKRTPKNTLLLTKLFMENFEWVTPAFEWFKKLVFLENGIGDSFSDLGSDDYVIKTLKEHKPSVLKFLNHADIGVDDFHYIRRIEETSRGLYTWPAIFKTIRKSTDLDNEFDLYTEESNGTRKMFLLACLWIDVLKSGKVLIVDELERSLHPDLVEFLVNAFHNSISNKRNSQLIFTTHSRNLIDTSGIFRRDQIWFVNKDYDRGDSNLYSLSDFEEEDYLNPRINYEHGAYDAVPTVNNSRFS